MGVGPHRVDSSKPTAKKKGQLKRGSSGHIITRFEEKVEVDERSIERDVAWESKEERDEVPAHSTASVLELTRRQWVLDEAPAEYGRYEIPQVGSGRETGRWPVPMDYGGTARRGGHCDEGDRRARNGVG